MNKDIEALRKETGKKKNKTEEERREIEGFNISKKKKKNKSTFTPLLHKNQNS